MIAPWPVAPTGGISGSLKAAVNPLTLFPRWLMKISDIWHTLQISHSSRKYSVERLLALDEYSQKASLLRVLLVCIGTPLPLVGVVLLQECVPLQDPQEGWNNNAGFWFRVALLVGVVAVSISVHSTYLIDGVKISARQHIMIFISQAGVYLAAAMAIAAKWVFPIPFIALSLEGIFLVIFLVVFYAIVDRKAIENIRLHKAQLLLMIALMSVQTLMALIYPAFQVLFNKVTNTRNEIPVLLLLPVIKLSMKNLLSLTISHMEDMIPEAVIFTVDFFNSLYLASCMQNTSSLASVLTIMTVDFTQAALEVRRQHQHAAGILSHLQMLGADKQSDGGLLRAMRFLCCDPGAVKSLLRSGICIHSCLPHVLSSEAKFILQHLKNIANGSPVRVSGKYSPRRKEKLQENTTSVLVRVSSPRKMKVKKKHPSKNAVVPFATRRRKGGVSFGQETQKDLSILLADEQDIFRQVLEIYFTAECTLLTEYLEFVVPTIYGCYILVMVQLPSSHYHSEVQSGAGNVVDITLHGVFLNAAMEFLSFLLLVAMLRKKCGMRALTHIAFVLETQMPLVQSLLFTWMLMTLSFRIEHFGVDFMFVFAWISNK